jgi:Purine-cytosine permease and related proteins
MFGYMVEQIGIEHIDSNMKKGNSRSLFFLWFAANLTIADFAIGFIPITLGMSFLSGITSILIGNVLGALIVGFSAAMGPKTGYPQMMSTTNSMGTLGMRIFGIINLSNTLGWFIVNNIIAVSAIFLIFHYPPWIMIMLYTILILIISYIGHDFIHKVEKILAFSLGILFLVMLILAVYNLKSTPMGGNLILNIPFFGMIAFTYSYLMSWGPYASDYSRYLPENEDTKKVFLFTFLGSFISTTFVEIAAMLISYEFNSYNSMQGLQISLGKYFIIGLILIALGGISANVLNLYSSSLSGLVGGIRMKRTSFILILALLGFLLSVIFYNGFYNFFESFLLVLDYWISPWISILIMDFFIIGNKKLVFSRRINYNGILAYILGLLVSVPFMDISIGNLNYVFPISKLLGGIDISYFVSFIASGIIYLLLNFLGKGNNTLSLNKDVN